MNFPIVLDIALGLVFIFFVLSLLASETQEIIGTLLQWRAEHLKQSIEVLLAGNEREKAAAAQELADALYESPWIRSLNQEAKGSIARSFRRISHFIGRVYRTLTGQRNVFGVGKTSGPSYIPPEAFANSLLERMQLGSLWQVLANDRIYGFTRDRVLAPVTNILSDLKASTGNEFLLNAELQQLEVGIHGIIDDFQAGIVSLPESLDRVVNRLEEFGFMATDILPDNHPLTETFLRRLEYIKRGLASTPTEKAALLSKLRPNVAQLLDIFDSNSPAYSELSRLARGGNPDAQVLIDRLAKAPITPALRSSLAAIACKVEVTADAARDDVTLFGYELEKWFDRGMERATGVYKRNAKAVALLIGIATAVSINADSFHIATRLAVDPILRSSITQTADQLVADSPGDFGQELEQVQVAVNQALDDIPFPLGYGDTVVRQQLDAEESWPIPFIPRRLIGWLVSGFAISMGSTFWFNVLKKVVNVRNTGGKPEGVRE
ncbi:hypothetical protein IQ273_24835 [Nodosilinea sp. LEGE 07298]|uniref:hypothetical protein n=1 Tax=Nodosilinea sp. LEGE 07298 TaxID=2777970 RepID=UPI0018807BC2|nr:hypothetical protein [Nodosilinea sp. LEGE 07298]MBE9112622.1 hypothetical protein [Nodosilinea sp. LEGE 07298]